MKKKTDARFTDRAAPLGRDRDRGARGVPYRMVRASTETDSVPGSRRSTPCAGSRRSCCPAGRFSQVRDLIHPGLAHPRRPASARRRRAKAIRGLVFIAANCYAALGVSDHPDRWTIAKTGSTRAGGGCAPPLHRNWEIFADTFDARPSEEKRPARSTFSPRSSRRAREAHLAESRPRFLGPSANQGARIRAPVFPRTGAHEPKKTRLALKRMLANGRRAGRRRPELPRRGAAVRSRSEPQRERSERRAAQWLATFCAPFGTTM
jgi:GST-like protein